jgi:hypothetical protein
VATYVPHTLDQETGTKTGLYGAIQFELFAPHPTAFLNYERTVSTAFEAGKWRFDANGSVQDFEDTSQYHNRRILDRFSLQTLKKYCTSVGIQVDSPDFYRGSATLVWTEDPLPKDALSLTLTEARARMGFSPPKAK